MRTIKFRAWDFQRNQWAKESEARESMGFIFGTNDYFNNIAGEKSRRWDFQQFTGLHDKNGVEIYEGDFVEVKNKNPKVNDKIFVITFEDGCFCLRQIGTMFFSGAVGLRQNIVNCRKKQNSDPIYKVVGNIHQKPELL